MRRATGWLAVVVLLCLVALDLAVGGLCRGTRLADRRVDIQHPTTLMVKLDRLRAAPGPKIVLLGDSLVYGGILDQFGDPDWREHGLAEHLVTELRRRPGPCPFVMNLGMDGLLPADLEQLVPLVVACGADWVVFDVHLRPFSADFSPPDRQMSRPWLRDLSADADGRVSWRPAGGVTEWAAARLADHSALVRNRAVVQENLLATGLARRPALRPAPPTADTDGEIQSLVKLAQLKNRLRTLDLGPDDPQAAALRRTLMYLGARGPRHIVFYAKENPALLADLMDPDEHAARFEQVVRLVRAAQGPRGLFVPPVPELGPEHFLDFTHLNADGYQLLARQLAAAID